MSESTASPPRVRPRSGSYLVRLDEIPDEIETSSGLIVRTDKNTRASTGEIVRESEHGEFALGDRVIFSPYSGYELSVDGRDYLMLSESEILGWYEEDAHVSVH